MEGGCLDVDRKLRLIAINYFNRRLIAIKKINRCTALVSIFRKAAVSVSSLTLAVSTATELSYNMRHVVADRAEKKSGPFSAPGYTGCLIARRANKQTCRGNAA